MKNLKWTREKVNLLFKTPFLELIYKAQSVHRLNFNPQEIQMSTLLSIKTGGCAEDCKYCSQSSRYKTGLKNEKLLNIEKVIDYAMKAKESGSTRFCMGAAWSNPHERDMPLLENMVKKVKELGLETCMTLGKLTKSQAERFYKAGLDYYSHNLDTSPEFYNSIITTRSYQDRLDTLDHVRKSGMKVCSGGILGLGEKPIDRIALLVQLANLPTPPESIPINKLVKGTPLENSEPVDDFDYIRVIAVARIMMPSSYIRIGAGRDQMSELMQSLCFMAGANSIFYGTKLLTAPNRDDHSDLALFKKLGLKINKLKNEAKISFIELNKKQA